MRIALVQSHLDHPGFWGGTLLTRQIAIGLGAAGHDVHAVEVSHEPATHSARQAGFTLHRLPAAAMLEGINPLWAWAPIEADTRAAGDWLARLAPDVVYGHMFSENTALYEAAIRMGLPLVQHVHDFAFLCGRSFLVNQAGQPCEGPTLGRCEPCLRARFGPLVQIGMRAAALPGGEPIIRAAVGGRRAERFRLPTGLRRAFAFSERYRESVARWIATGPRIRDVLTRHGVSADRVTILPHSLPDDRLVPSPPPPPLAGRPVRIGYFGRVSPEKGVVLLARAVARLARSSARSFEWRIISGSVPDVEKARVMAASGLPPERVRFVEGLTGAALNPEIAQLDLCVIPSLWPEIGPLTLLEALAQGVPCVCTDSAGHAHLVEHGVNGLLFRAGDEDDLRAQLASCLADDSVIERMRGRPATLAGFDTFVSRIAEELAAASRRPEPATAS